jgi:hypothetical protein
MREKLALPFVLLLGGLPACGATTSRAGVDAAELQARSAQADAAREHARLVELEARLVEMEQRLAAQTRACRGTPDPLSVEVASARPRPVPDPRRSQGDFLTEARAVEPPPPQPAGVAPNAEVALARAPSNAPAGSERQHVERLLEGLRQYGVDSQSGLSVERREALRVLLRRERPLDLVNPWAGH